MSRVPACQPDGPKIRALIWERGCSVAEFARSIDRNKQTIWGILANGDRASIKSIKQIARELGVNPADISDMTDEDVSEPEPKVPAA
jgi:transcriptional regulator with XRE-family HTH domain